MQLRSARGGRDRLIGDDLRSRAQPVLGTWLDGDPEVGASTNSDVIWQMMTDAWSCGNASLWTMTPGVPAVVAGGGDRHDVAARHLPSSSETASIHSSASRSPCGFQSADLCRHPFADLLRTRIGHHEAQLAQPPGAPALPHRLHPFCRAAMSFPLTAARECNALQ